MSRHFGEWGNVDVALMPYLRGKYLVSGPELSLDDAVDADGAEYDTLIERDLRFHSAGAWVKLDRLPASVDPLGLAAREIFPIFSASAIAGGENTSTNIWVNGTGVGNPSLTYGVLRTSAAAVSFSLATSPPPIQVDKWFFVGFSYADGGLGPRMYFGDLESPMSEVVYFSQSDGSGLHGLVNPGVKVSTGHWVDRWGFGPFLIGAYTLPLPVNGPGQFYGQLGGANARFHTMKGLLAHATMWGGPLTLTQWEQLRTALPTSRLALPSQGFPSLIADWWLDASLIDRSGHGHDLVSILTQASSDSPYPEVRTAGNAPSGFPGGIFGYPAVQGPA